MDEVKRKRFYRRWWFLLPVGCMYLAAMVLPWVWPWFSVTESKEFRALTDRIEIAGGTVVRADSDQLSKSWLGDALNNLKYFERGYSGRRYAIVFYAHNAALALSEEDMKLIGRQPYIDMLSLGEIAPGSFQHLKKMKLTNVHFNKTALSHEDFCLMARMPIRYVSFHGVQLTSKDLDELLKVSDIVWMEMREMTLDGDAIGIIARTKSIGDLRLVDVPLTDEGMETISGLASLASLAIPGTRVTDSGLTHLKSRVSLLSLDLSRTEVTDRGLTHLAPLTGLDFLTLSGTRITDDGVPALASLAGLQKLSLDNTTITDSGLESLAKLSKLYHLDLSGTAVTDEGMKHLVNIPRLSSLSLKKTAITDAGLEELTKVPRLAYLNLEGTQVTDAGVEHLKKMKLWGINLKNTSVSEEKIAELREANPRIVIEK